MTHDIDYVDLFATTFERLYKVIDAIHGGLTKAVDREAMTSLAHIRCQEQLHSSKFVVVGAHVSYQVILSLSVGKQQTSTLNVPLLDDDDDDGEARYKTLFV